MQEGRKMCLQPSSPLHWIVTESRLDWDCICLSTSVDMCFPSDWAAGHLTLASSHELNPVWPINREKKARSCAQTLLMQKYFWILVWLGPRICQTRFTPACFGFSLLHIIISPEPLWPEGLVLLDGPTSSGWTLPVSWNVMLQRYLIWSFFFLKDWRRKPYIIFCKTRSHKQGVIPTCDYVDFIILQVNKLIKLVCFGPFCEIGQRKLLLILVTKFNSVNSFWLQDRAGIGGPCSWRQACIPAHSLSFLGLSQSMLVICTESINLPSFFISQVSELA